MICVSIGRGRHKHMIAEHAHLVEQGAELVELRLDFIRRDVNLRRLLAERPCPVIVTCRREQDGGRWTGKEADRLMLLRTAIAEGVEYIDLEEDVAGSIPRYGKTKRIVSLHNFQETPHELQEIYERLAAMDADIVKIAAMAHHPHDNLRMLRLVRDAKVPTVGICMGEIGMPSRILCGKFGSPYTYATFHHERALAPGQISFQHTKDLYRYDAINAETEVFGVIADPVGHSLSPVVHNAAFRDLEMNRVYLPFRVPREHLEQFVQDCRELGVRGLSVTIPHKEAILKLLTHSDAVVRGIGAANTVVFAEDRVEGYNTDHHAAMQSLERALRRQQEAAQLAPEEAAVAAGSQTRDDTHAELADETASPLSGRVALLLGAGGVARAIAYGLSRRRAQVVVAGRTLERSEALAKRVGGQAVEWNRRFAVKADIVINCTPLGMHPNVDETPYEGKFLREGAVVFDTVYNPEQTLFIKEGRQRGCVTVTGVDMFVSQAAMQFELFTGKKAPTDLMRREMKRAIGPVKI